jgi:hypothetical protein
MLWFKNKATNISVIYRDQNGFAEWGRWCVSTLGMSAMQILEFVPTSINFGNNGYHVSIH